MAVDCSMRTKIPHLNHKVSKLSINNHQHFRLFLQLYAVVTIFSQPRLAGRTGRTTLRSRDFSLGRKSTDVPWCVLEKNGNI